VRNSSTFVAGASGTTIGTGNYGSWNNSFSKA
jgi:hypothetical protein